METITPREIKTMRGEIPGESNYTEVETTIESSDEEDGGAEYRIIVFNKTTGKFYSFYCTDWELGIRNELDDSDLSRKINMKEVNQVAKTVMVYE
jgi:hypothetical protein